jgi:hypothetical protein
MEQTRNADEAQPFSVTLEIVPEDEQNPDPAVVSAVGRNIISDLQRDGYTVERIPTGQKGGIEILLQVMMQAGETAWTDIMAQKDTIDVLAGLSTIFITISPLLRRLFHAQEKQPAEEYSQLSIHIDESGIDIQSLDVVNDERIAQLAKRFLQLYPQTHVTPHTQLRVRQRVSGGKKSRRRS